MGQEFFQKHNFVGPAVGESVICVILETSLVWEETPTVVRSQVPDSRSSESLREGTQDLSPVWKTLRKLSPV